MKVILLQILCLPLDLIFLTYDSLVISFRMLKRLLRKQKSQRCHLCQGESNLDAPHPVRAVLKYHNKWMVGLFSSCIRFRKVEGRRMGFCHTEGDYTRPPLWVPLVAAGMMLFWIGGSFTLLNAVSTDPENFGRNFIALFNPDVLGDRRRDVEELGEITAQLNPERAERYYLSGVKSFDQQNFPSAQVDFKIAIQSNPVDAKLYFQLARAQMAMGEMVQGESSLKKTLEFDPEHVEALLMLSELLERRESRQQALELASRALKLEPQNTRALRLNIGLLTARGDRERVREMIIRLMGAESISPDTLAFVARIELSLFQDAETARRLLEQALAVQPEHIPSLTAMIYVDFKEQNPAKGLERSDQVLRLSPDNLEVLRLQADTIRDRFGPGAGLRAYERLLNKFGSNHELRLRYAELLLQNGNISEGKRLAGQLTSSRIPQVERAAHWMLAQMYAQARMHDEAMQHGRSVLRLTPDASAVHIFLSQQLMLANRPMEAQREAESALSMNRQDSRAVDALIQALLRQNKTRDALELLDRLLAEFPEADALRHRKALIYMNGEEWQLAMADILMLQEKYPEDATLRNNLAFLLARSGEQLDRALSLATSLVEQAPDNPIILDTQAFVLAAMGRHEEALPIYEKALTLVPLNTMIRFHYAKTLIALGRGADAYRHLEAVLMMMPDFPQSAEVRELMAAHPPGGA